MTTNKTNFQADVNIAVLAEGLGFPEGPVYMEDGSILFVELRERCVSRLSPEGKRTVVAECGGGPNGMAIGPDGAAYVCNNGGSKFEPNFWRPSGTPSDYKGGSIQRVDLKTGEVRTLYTECDGHPLTAPNDLVFDRHGGFYFTDMGKLKPRHRDHGGVYYAQPDGSAIAVVAFPFHAANGIALSPDQKTLYVAETETARIWCYEIEAPGRVRKMPFPSPNGGRLLHGLPGFQRVDSMAVDGDGNVCVGTLVTGKITVISPEGSLLGQISFPDMWVTNLCFGGADMKTAYVTLCETGRLVSIPWPVSGLRLNFNA